MKNLEGKELYDLFYDCLMEANKSDAETLQIRFKFKTWNNYDIEPIEIDRIFFNFEMNGITFCEYDPETGEKNSDTNDIAIKMILYNLHYNYFNLLDKQIYKGERVCCGHGEYFKTDRYVYIFYRYKDEEKGVK